MYIHRISHKHPNRSCTKNKSVKFQLPPATSRPELGLHRYQGPFRTDHDYQHIVQHSGNY